MQMPFCCVLNNKIVIIDTMHTSLIKPFPDPNLFAHAAIAYLEPKDIFNLAITCKQNNEWSKIPLIWQKASEKEGLPQVANFDGTPRTNPKEDFRVLHPITLSGKKIGKFFGKVIGSVSPIKQYYFDKLSEPEPFDPPNALLEWLSLSKKRNTFGENFRFVVKPSYVERMATKEAPLALDKDGNLVKVDPDKAVEETLTIPFSLRNFQLLCKYPLKNNTDGSIFNKHYKEIFESSTSFSKQITIDMMRLNILEESKGLDFPKQELLIQKRAPTDHFTVTSMLTRLLWDSYSILAFGTCPDCGIGQPIRRYARSPDIAITPDRTARLVIGGFTPDSELDVILECSSSDDEDVGVVPSVSAEELESLTLKLDHLIIDIGEEY